MTNHKVQVGDIFLMHLKNGDSDVCHFAQVTRLKGKTMAEFSYIRKEYFLDETCDITQEQCRVRPLPGQFFDETPQVYIVRVMDEGSHVRMVSHAKALRFVFERYDPEKVYRLCGQDGRYAIEKFELVPKAEK